MRVLATRGDRVDLDVVLRALDGEHAGEADEAHLGGAVVGLAEVAEDAGARRGVDDAAVALLAHVDPGRAGDVERALEVHVEHRVDQVGRHVVERLVAQDAGVVDDDVDLAERVDGGLDDGLAALGRGDGVVVGHGLAAGRLDLVDDLSARPRRRTAGAVDRAAEVVDDDQRAALGEQERVGAAEAAAGAGDDRDLAVEPEISHACSWCGRSRGAPGRGPGKLAAAPVDPRTRPSGFGCVCRCKAPANTPEAAHVGGGRVETGG